MSDDDQGEKLPDPKTLEGQRDLFSNIASRAGQIANYARAGRQRQWNKLSEQEGRELDRIDADLERIRVQLGRLEERVR